MSQFLWTVPDLIVDVPKLDTYLSITLNILFELNTDLSYLEWANPEATEEPMVEAFFKVMAKFLARVADIKQGDWKGVAKYFKDTFERKFLPLGHLIL